MCDATFSSLFTHNTSPCCQQTPPEKGKVCSRCSFCTLPFAKTPCCVEQPLVMSQGALTPAVGSVLWKPPPEVPAKHQRHRESQGPEFLQQAANKGLITLFSCDRVRDLQTLFYPLDLFQATCSGVCVCMTHRNRKITHNFVFILFVHLCAFFFLSVPVNLFVDSGSIQRAIILNGEIKGLQSSSVIQLSVTWLISRRRRGDGPGRASQRERGERKVNVNDALDSTPHPNYSKLLLPLSPVWH